MQIVKCKQGSPEWLEARRGVCTASEFKRFITAVKAEYSTTGARTYICELIAERYHLGRMDDFDTYESAAMRNGKILEPEARRWYEFERGVKVNEVGFILSDCGRFGWSPDAIVETGNERGALELKCPAGKTHVSWLLDGKLPDEHWQQCHGGIDIGELDWIDFMSYRPDFPPLLVRVHPGKLTDKLREARSRFADDYDALLNKLDLPEPDRPKPMTLDDLPAMLAQ